MDEKTWDEAVSFSASDYSKKIFQLYREHTATKCPTPQAV
jgi:hypothetical protein